MARINFKRNHDPLDIENDRAKKIYALKKQFEAGEIQDKWIDLGESSWNGYLSEIKNIILDQDELEKVFNKLPDLSEQELKKLYDEYKNYPSFWYQKGTYITRKDYFFNKHKLVTINVNGEVAHFKTKETPHATFAKDWAECEHRWNQLVEYAHKSQIPRERAKSYQLISNQYHA